jgi:tetratricopeptide (TPR) repeat protein
MVRRFGAAVVAALLPLTADAQARPITPPTDSVAAALGRALDAEDRNDLAVASASYKTVLAATLAAAQPDGDRVAIALLGLERIWAERGQLDSVVPLVTRVLQRRPTDPIAHAVRLRSLTTLGRNDEARAAFGQWRRTAGADATPYREYARLLMQQGRTLAADTLLTEAGRLMGTGGLLSGETAQLHVALQRWEAAAQAFREALVEQPWLETAALFGLQRTPAPARDSVRAVLLAPLPQLEARRLLASLEFSWGEPRRAWAAVSTLPVNDSTVAAWRAFGERAEMNDSWTVARDAWTAVFGASGDDESRRRAADAALRAGDADGALAMVRRGAPVGAGATRGTARDAATVRAMLALEIAALGELGRGDEAQRLLDGARGLDADARMLLMRPLVTGWLRTGDVARARTAMRHPDLADDDELAGWLALYDGDLITARRRLVRAVSSRPELVDALGLLARIRRDTLPALGEAFVLLARRDSAAAATRLVRLADSVGTAAPALLAQGARLMPRREALALYARLVADFPRSPEAPEALLAWARALRDANDTNGAVAKLEQLLIEYPGSALAPQARRDLERARGTVPPV